MQNAAKTNERMVYRNNEADDIMGGIGFDRYIYDLKLCTKSKGWKQFDTADDAWYHGVWVNLAERKTFTYCEGDRILVVCPTLESFKVELDNLVAFHGDAPPTLTLITKGAVTKYYDERPHL